MMSRATKEIRPLLLPAGLILAATFLSVWWSSWGHTFSTLARQLALTSFFLGFPLLASSSIGAEFQQRTLGLLVSQPVSRTRLWFEKWSALVLVAGVTAAIQLSFVKVGLFESGHSLGPVLFVVAMVCSAPLWTLVARSTIGGTAFSIAAVMIPQLALSLARGWLGHADSGPDMFANTPLMNGLRLLYCAVTLGVGCWMFTRLEVTGSGYAHAVTVAGGREAWPAFLRCQPNTPVLNLIRKEVRLQRPTFLVAGLFTVCWVLATALFAVRPPRDPVTEVTFTILLASYLPLAMVLAGAISIGDESTLGIHGWHLTLPVRASTQWVVKLSTALVVGVLTVVVLSVALHSLSVAWLGKADDVLRVQFRPRDLAVAATAIVLCFWAATLFGHTVRAAVASGAILIGLGLCGSMAFRLGDQTGLGPAILTRAMVRWQLPPDFFIQPLIPFLRAPTFGRVLVPSTAGLMGLFCVVAASLSFRAFRRLQVDRSFVVRQVAAVFIVVSLVSTVASTYIAGAGQLAWSSAPARELIAALHTLSAGGTRPSFSPSAEDLGRTGLVSTPTREWLNGATISTRKMPRGPYARPSLLSVYEVTVKFPNGRIYITRYLDPPPGTQR